MLKDLRGTHSSRRILNALPCKFPQQKNSLEIRCNVRRLWSNKWKVDYMSSIATTGVGKIYSSSLRLLTQGNDLLSCYTCAIVWITYNIKPVDIKVMRWNKKLSPVMNLLPNFKNAGNCLTNSLLKQKGAMRSVKYVEIAVLCRVHSRH